jgi:hypothetical protein
MESDHYLAFGQSTATTYVQSGPHSRGHRLEVEPSTAVLPDQRCLDRIDATPQSDAPSGGRHHESGCGRRFLAARPRPVSLPGPASVL